MRVLWLSNIVLPQICRLHRIPEPPSGGWITAMIDGLKEMQSMEFYVLCASTEKWCSGKTEDYQYTLFNESTSELKKEFKKIIYEWKPDVIHVFGTEFPHSLMMVQAAKELDMDRKVIVSIQGLVGMCGKHYRAFLPEYVCYKQSLRDFIKKDNIAKQQKLFLSRGEYEKRAIESVKYILGRTEWDYTCVKRINPNIKYFKCNENLRKEFYSGEWDIEKIEEHSIFTSQCSYPLKGFHLMIEAMRDIVKEYPDAHLYTVGMNPFKLTKKQRIRQTYYNKYLGILIRRYRLQENITFLPSLNAEAMKARFLKSHVFVCCSSIENSSNSLGEAMLLGIPCVVSYTGGNPSMISSDEGYLYQADAPYMLAEGIIQIFKSKERALFYSTNGRKRAYTTHDTNANIKELLQAYRYVMLD